MANILKCALWGAFAIVFTIASFAIYLRWFQPAFYLPKPTGPYAVGMQQFYWVDTKRLEQHAHDPAHPYRELMVKAWYPTQKPAQDFVTPYAPAYLRFYQQTVPVFRTLVDGAYRPTFAYYIPEAPILASEKPFPVIIFSHGSGVPDEHYTIYLTELASHGYVVFSVNHTYDCEFVDFPGGRRVAFVDEWVKRAPDKRDAWRDEHVLEWVADDQFVLDQVMRESRDSHSVFYQKLDLSRVAIFGHSRGGATATQCCRRDSRFKAGVNLDGSLGGPDFDKPFAKPFMFLHQSHDSCMKQLAHASNSEQKAAMLANYQTRFCPVFDKLVAAIGPDARSIDIPGAGHMAFSDGCILKYRSLFPRWFDMGAGIADGYEIMRTVNNYLVEFFDKHLKK